MADPPIRLTVGGDVQANNGTYLKRPADKQLFEACLENKFAYVLACRQIGKSSLKNAVAEQLLAEGIRVARIDLNRIGQEVKGAEDWYFNLLDELARTLQLRIDVEAWWESKPRRLTLTQRFLRFLDEVVLTEISGPVVIFIDEIDMMLGLHFTDDFFTAIRTVYNDRAQNPAYQRLTFVLLGVATPDELINNPKRTPFNIGQAIPMRDFTQTECSPLRLAIEAKHTGQSDAYFQQIYDWTNGHPYLTQKLCWAVVNAPPTDDPRLVDNLAKATFLIGEKQDEDNLRFVEKRVLDDAHQLQMLRTYRQILRGETVPDNEKLPAVNRLKLYGLVIAENGRLAVRNRVYREVFNRAWVRKNIPTNWRRIVTYLAVVVAVLAVGSILYNAWVGIHFQDCYASFYQTKAPEERVAHLARIFRLRGLFGPTDYDYQARELFYGLSREEQLALFDIDNAVKDSDLIVLVRGLYTTLADTDDTDSTRPLLEAVVNALGGLTATEETERLESEISSWLEGRKLAKQAQYADALAEYSNAIASNGENPATLYERAKVLTKLMEHEQALGDLDQVIAIARRAPAPTPTASPATTEPAASPSLTPTSTLIPGADMTPSEVSPSASVITTSGPSPIFTETPIPTATPTPAAIISEFATTGEMIGAVRNMIYGNPELVSSLASAQDSEYPNLREFGLVPTPVPTLTPTSTPPEGVMVVAALSPMPTFTPTQTGISIAPSPTSQMSISTPTSTPTLAETPPLPPPTLPILTQMPTTIPTPTWIQTPVPPTTTATATPRPPTSTPAPTVTPPSTGPITLTIYLRHSETDFVALSGDQLNGGIIYREGQFVYGEAAVQIGNTVYHFDKPEVALGEPEQLPAPWRVEFEFDEMLLARTESSMAGFDSTKAQFWVGILGDQSAVGEDNPYSLMMKLYEGDELRESIQVFFTVADAPESGGGEGKGTPPP